MHRGFLVLCLLAFGGVSRAGPLSFAFPATEGNYRVTVTVGDPLRPAVTTVKAELRRLMAGPVRTAAGEFRQLQFVVNVRQPKLPDGTTVRLKPREKTGEIADWDDRLSLEIDGGAAGESPAVAAIDVAPAPSVPTIYLAGDSTVCDQPYEPFASWGQMLPRFFDATVAVANHAESGESLRSFFGEHRMAKLDTLMRTGDYLLIQFGHNDQKERGPGVGAMTTYKQDLERMVADARARGATPIVITAVSRRTFGPDGRIRNSLGDYPAAVRAVAAEQHVTLIDLNAMSTRLYETLGPGPAAELFPLARGQREATHHDNYGAYEIAQCIAEGIRTSGLPLARALRSDFHGFDPTRPDPLAGFALPASPRASEEKPYGN